MRKTVRVDDLRNKANTLFASPDSTPEQRKAVAGFVSGFLHATGNYHGYNYLDWLSGGYDRWVADGKPRDTGPYLGDETRIVFYGGGSESRGELEARFPKRIGSGQ